MSLSPLRGGACEIGARGRDIATAYGKIEALKGVSLSAEKGRITCLLGPNGAGKTTLMLTIAGILKPKRGSIRLDGAGDRGAHQRQDRRARAGAGAGEPAGVPADERQGEPGGGRLPAPGRTPASRRTSSACTSAFRASKERHEQLAGTLSGGEQQMLAVARALMSRPRILLMDEPSLGLAPMVVEEVFRIVGDLNRDGVTIFLVEQNAHMALKVAHHFYLMEQGRVTFSGEPGKLAEDEVVQRAYLGTRRASA